MCFLSSNISVFPRKTTFSISRPDMNLARLNWAKKQPFIEGKKVVIHATNLLHKFSLSKKARLQENWINLIIFWVTKA